MERMKKEERRDQAIDGRWKQKRRWSVSAGVGS
jgi:hypothetical protein